MTTYAEEMSRKIIKATPSEMREIAEEIETEVYEQLTHAAKARVDEVQKEE